MEVIILPREALSTLGLVLMVIMIPTLLPSKSRSGNDVATYNSEKVMRLLGHNQGALRILGDGYLGCMVGRGLVHLNS